MIGMIFQALKKPAPNYDERIDAIESDIRMMQFQLDQLNNRIRYLFLALIVVVVAMLTDLSPVDLIKGLVI